jgi:hypothetical protein
MDAGELKNSEDDSLLVEQVLDEASQCPQVFFHIGRKRANAFLPPPIDHVPSASLCFLPERYRDLVPRHGQHHADLAIRFGTKCFVGAPKALLLDLCPRAFLRQRGDEKIRLPQPFFLYLHDDRALGRIAHHEGPRRNVPGDFDLEKGCAPAHH